VQAPTDPDWRKTLTNVGYSKKSEKGKINKKACVVKSSKWMMEKSAGTINLMVQTCRFPHPKSSPTDPLIKSMESTKPPKVTPKITRVRIYPLVNIQKAIENGHRNRGFSQL
jgi:hypothetical protein